MLVVEDDPATGDALARMLELSGAVVRSARSAAQAREIFAEHRPEVIVCDLAMPDEDGYGFLRRNRALGAAHGGHVPALALSALAAEKDCRRAFAAGFQMHLAKPVDIDRLTAALTELLATPAARPWPEAERVS